jgi:hypothetical protein
MLSGCPGTLDPSQFQTVSGSGGTTGTGGSGTGGTANNDCTGGNDGATIVSTICAASGCHDTADANTFGAGLDLTVNSSIGSRLVGVQSPGDINAGAACTGNTEPYLVAQSSPATGLLIDKLNPTPPCGSRMPYVGPALTTTQQTCLIQWATTLTSP